MFFTLAQQGDFNREEDLKLFLKRVEINFDLRYAHHSLDVFNKEPSKHRQWQPHDLPGHSNLL